MCTGAELAAVGAFVGTAATVYSTVEAADARKDAKAEAAKVAAERKKAEADAMNKAGARTAMLRRAISANSLYTGAGTAGGMGGATTGRTTLGV